MTTENATKLDMDCPECGEDDVISESLEDGEAVVKCQSCRSLATSWGATF